MPELLRHLIDDLNHCPFHLLKGVVECGIELAATLLNLALRICDFLLEFALALLERVGGQDAALRLQILIELLQLVILALQALLKAGLCLLHLRPDSLGRLGSLHDLL